MKKGLILILLFLMSTFMTSCSSKTEAPEAATEIKAAQDLVSLLQNQDFDNAEKMFDEGMKKALPSKKLSEVWGTIIKDNGSFEKQMNARAEKAGEYIVVIITGKFEKASLDIKVTVNSKQEIAGLFFTPK